MDQSAELLKTPLYDLHLELGARMVPFAGYDMPVQYPAGVMKEHLHTRAKCGLFDVSHMGQVELRAMSGTFEDAALALESLVPVDILGLKPGRQRYGFFTDDNGGILDDLMFANRGDHLYVVVNAGCKQADIAHMKKHLSERVEVTYRDDRALLALQGPRSEVVLASLGADVAAMKFMDVRDVTLCGAPCIVSRSGYSGEDGFEISVPADKAEELARALLAHPDCEPIGLGARDSLRLEAGLCLYGNDIDTTTSPIEAGLEWAIQKTRRTGGAREGGFPGAGRILSEIDTGASRRRIGLKPEGKAPVRGHAKLYADNEGRTELGEVTSGGFGPSVEGPIAMGYVPASHAEPGTQIFAEVRGKYLPVTVAAMPFVTPTYKR
ncbi:MULTISPECIES: glycine cleavage system aminomethyltransferase GcvT [Alphaproteobacteria]|uniref:aminomethyltransferase n=2 Tax=Alphaproteobacteria TaxID=28211 RepID=A0A512HHQ4_9HYPH|nr:MULTISPECIES: glycine cleavage system aminomethyltransferase GcvT [Alphaproteobacteria]GEO84985.1 aminomethyltransferase [Ciceribacter naphthalenivorans]GLR22919.1 aminomethyltransferase [Ciceribacter naphthalenivorans]GLT05775.1 aminomethyltransferase [Sphingomonas psychrolutea]